MPLRPWSRLSPAGRSVSVNAAAVKIALASCSCAWPGTGRDAVVNARATSAKPIQRHIMLLPSSSLDQVRHTNPAEHLHGVCPPLGAAIGMAESHRQHDVLGDRERRQQLEELEDDADCAAPPPNQCVGPQVTEILPTDDHLTGIWLVDP